MLDDGQAQTKLIAAICLENKGARLWKGGFAMPRSLSHFRHPFEIASHPTLEPEVKRAILASWASDAASVEERPTLRHPPGLKKPIPFDDVLAALRSLDSAPQRTVERN